MSEKALVKRMKRFIADSFNYEAAMESAGLVQDDVDNFREILLSCDEVPRSIPDKMILLLLILRKKNIDESVKVARAYCAVNKESPEFFSNRDVESKEIQSCLDNQYYIALPPTPDNCNLLYHKLSNYEPKSHIFEDAEKTFFLAVEHCLYHNGPRNGFKFLFDMEGASLAHVFQISFSSLRKVMRIIQDACPFEIIAVHVLNTVPFLNLIIAMVKPLIRSDILNRMHFHSTNMDYEKFYEDCIPKSCLPSNYGGDLESIDELHDKHRKSLMKLREYFLIEEKIMNFELEDYDFDAKSFDDEEFFDTKM